MRITVDSTTRIVIANGIECRIWQGESQRGIRVQLMVPRIAADAGQDQSEFEAELIENIPPRGIQAFPFRMLI